MKHETTLVCLGDTWSWLCSCGEYGQEHAAEARARAHAEWHERTGNQA